MARKRKTISAKDLRPGMLVEGGTPKGTLFVLGPWRKAKGGTAKTLGWKGSVIDMLVLKGSARPTQTPFVIEMWVKTGNEGKRLKILRDPDE